MEGAVRGDGGVGGGGGIVGVPKFHSWGKCTMPLEYQVERFLRPVFILVILVILRAK